ncbi:MAG: SH3 domain-containing protein [Lachnospiraceae bacterium]|nr:SH3 domain-containing protein [Lachnospiraceae bacterium]
MSGKRQRNRTILTAFLATLGAVLLLLAAWFLFFGGKKTEEESVAEAIETQEEAADEETEEEDPQTLVEAEEGVETAISTVKEIASETDEITVGIDVSGYQGTIDWEQVAASGVDFAMVRVGYRTLSGGEIAEDACARYNLQEAAANGIQLGAYFFSTAVTEEEAREEAEWTAGLLAGYPITYPVAYNCEGFQSESSRQTELSVEERSNLAVVFLEEIEEQGYTGMFYAARNELADNLLWQTDELELQYRIWVAQYSSYSTDQPDYDGEYVMWQYTNMGSVPGIDGYVDLDIAYFGYSESAAAQDESAAEYVEADPEVGVTFEEVDEQVTAKDVTNLRSTMDQTDSSNIVAQLQNGEVAARTGKGNNGWSRLTYNGETLYAVSSYLTTDLSYTPAVEEVDDDGFKTKFTTVSENVTAKEVTNLRNRPSVEDPSEVIAQLYNGEVIVRTGVSDVGWSRVEYNGQTLYCISSYLQVVEQE